MPCGMLVTMHFSYICDCFLLHHNVLLLYLLYVVYFVLLINVLFLCQLSAGIYNHLKSTVIGAIHQDPTPDLHPDTLAALSSLMLAQAQEVFVHKAIHGKLLWI